MMNSTGKDFQAKQEDGSYNSSKLSFKATTLGQRQWTSLKNPRIVRVSRTFGGKDRHSKVYTIRGLRDRRIRLSVPTAIQLYDLQDKLGLSQPSKVIDWLIDATKYEIDKLPPLPIPPENFGQLHSSMFANSQELNLPQSSLPLSIFNANPSSMKDRGTQPLFTTTKQGIGTIQGEVENNDQTIMGKMKACVPDASLKQKFKGPDHEHTNSGINGNNYTAQVSAQNFFPMPGESSYPGFQNNIQYNPYYHWDINANLSLSQYGSNGLSSQREDSYSNNPLPLSSLSHPSGSQFCYHPSSTAASLVPPFTPLVANPTEIDPRQQQQLNYLQFLSSRPNSLMPSLHLHRSPAKSSTVNASPKILYPQSNEEAHLNNVGTSGS